MDFDKETGLINLGLIRGLANQCMTAAAIQGSKGYAPSNRNMRTVESLIDMNNQMQIKTGAVQADPFGAMKASLGLKPMDSAPAPAKPATDPRLDAVVKGINSTNYHIKELIKTLNGPPPSK